MTQVVSDEVWRQLDPYAGQLPRRTVRRLRLSVVLVVMLAAVVGGTWWSGVVLPRIEFANTGYSAQSDAAERRIEFDVTVVNRGWTPVQVRGAGRSGPGLELVAVRGDFPATVASGATLEFTVVYHVTDCAAVPSDPWPVPVRVGRPWGTYTAYVDLPHLVSDGAPSGSRGFAGRDPYAVEWQWWLADQACNPR